MRKKGECERGGSEREGEEKKGKRKRERQRERERECFRSVISSGIRNDIID